MTAAVRRNVMPKTAFVVCALLCMAIVPCALAATAAEHIHRADQLDTQHKTWAAIAELRRAVRAEPGNADAHSRLADALHTSHCTWQDKTKVSTTPAPAVLAEAIREQQKAVALSPRDVDDQLNLGRYLEEAGRRRQAIPHYEKVLRLLGPFAPVPLRGNMGDGRHDNTLRALNAHSSLASCLRFLHRNAEAVPHYREALKLDPTAYWLWLGLGNALNGMGRRTEARAAWQQTIARSQFNPGIAQEAKEVLARYPNTP